MTVEPKPGQIWLQHKGTRGRTFRIEGPGDARGPEAMRKNDPKELGTIWLQTRTVFRAPDGWRLATHTRVGYVRIENLKHSKRYSLVEDVE